ncbi:MAG: gamma-glutamyltransferase [Gammaproteobacteria bacterium]
MRWSGLLSTSKYLLACATGLALVACSTVSSPGGSINSRQAAVAMPDKFGADVSEYILQQGGNAVDAAIASGFALAVTFPEAGNIGGGGFMLIRMKDENVFLDYREKAPAMASRDMYLDSSGNVIDKASLIGSKSAGVPGTVAGFWAAHQRFGSLPWRDLVKPAIALAEDGFVMPKKLADDIADTRDWFGTRTNFFNYFGNTPAGSVFRQPELADTLRRIADNGPAGFYAGKTAQLITAQMKRGGGGLISVEDLAAYEPVWREPLVADWRQYTLISAPPPSSGGFAVIQLLKMKDRLASEFDGVAHNSDQYVHLVAEIEKRVFADRAEYLGDPDFIDVPLAQLIDERYIHSRADEVNTQTISPVESVPPGLESKDTTHYSIVDADGNAVSNTYTINWHFGSGVVVEGAGFILNNEMDDFSVKPGVPNVYGVVGNTANEIQPGKRMLSSMSPTILVRNNKVNLVVGTPGGSTIFTSVFQAISNVLDFNMSPQEAVDASRFHHQLLPPDLVTYSPSRPLAEDVQKTLTSRGYNVKPHAWEFGDLQLIYRDGNALKPASDSRGRGASRVIEVQ